MFSICRRSSQIISFRLVLIFLFSFISSIHSHGQEKILFEQEGVKVTYQVNYDRFRLKTVVGWTSQRVPVFKVEINVVNQNPDTVYYMFWVNSPSARSRVSFMKKLAGNSEAGFWFTLDGSFTSSFSDFVPYASDIRINREDFEKERANKLDKLCDQPVSAEQRELLLKDFSGKWIQKVSNWDWHDARAIEVTEDGYIHISKFKNRRHYKRNIQTKDTTFQYEICGDRLYFNHREQNLFMQMENVLHWDNNHSKNYTRERRLHKYEPRVKGRR